MLTRNFATEAITYLKVVGFDIRSDKDFDIESLNNHCIAFLLQQRDISIMQSYLWLKKHWDKIVKYYNHPKFQECLSYLKIKKYRVKPTYLKDCFIITNAFDNKADKHNFFLYSSKDGKTVNKEMLDYKALIKRRKEKSSYALGRLYLHEDRDEDGEWVESESNGIYYEEYIKQFKKKEVPDCNEALATFYHEQLTDTDHIFYVGLCDLKQRDALMDFSKIVSILVVRRVRSQHTLFLTSMAALTTINNYRRIRRF